MNELEKVIKEMRGWSRGILYLHQDKSTSNVIIRENLLDWVDRIEAWKIQFSEQLKNQGVNEL